MPLFSKRQLVEPTEFHEGLDDRTRTRLLLALADHTNQAAGGNEHLFDDLADVLTRAYGELRQSSYNLQSMQGVHPAFEHFQLSGTDEILDFLEAAFQSQWYTGGQHGVQAVNSILREVGYAYEFTPYGDPKIERDATGKKVLKQEFPQAICRGNQLQHATVTLPTLELLAGPKFRVANSEMLGAHAAFRVGQYEDAITSAGSAFESVLKTICTEKGWAFDPSKDTCAKLIDVCYSHSLFPSFYVEVLKGAGTVRNKLGDAHGRGPSPQHVVDKDHAEHLIHLVGTHILFLARAAGMA